MAMLDFSYIPAKHDGTMARPTMCDCDYPIMHEAEHCAMYSQNLIKAGYTSGKIIKTDYNTVETITESELRVLDGNR